jgi:hypothetical protein
MNGRYKLEGRTPVPVDDLIEWAAWFERAREDCVVRQEERRGVRVSTVFLGLDHQFGSGRPLLFETLVFGGRRDGKMNRYATWEDAEQGHRELAAEAFGCAEEGGD